MNLIDSVTDNVTNICCGVLCYKLNNISTTAPRERLLLPDAQYYVRNKLAESYKEGIVLVFLISGSIITFSMLQRILNR